MLPSLPITAPASPLLHQHPSALERQIGWPGHEGYLCSNTVFCTRVHVHMFHAQSFISLATNAASRLPIQQLLQNGMVPTLTADRRPLLAVLGPIRSLLLALFEVVSCCCWGQHLDQLWTWKPRPFQGDSGFLIRLCPNGKWMLQSQGALRGHNYVRIINEATMSKLCEIKLRFKYLK